MSSEGSISSRIERAISRLNAGETSARQDLVEHAMMRLHLLARRQLRHFPRVARWEQTDDVLQNATLRLLRALREVRPTSMAQFFSLAGLQIRRELLDLARHYYGPEGLGKNQVSHPGQPSGALSIGTRS